MIRSSGENSSRMLGDSNGTTTNETSSESEEGISASDLEIKEASIILSNSVIKSI